MIKSINLKNVATYDPKNGVTINNLKKINFIYGTNGCGKTTLSNYLLDPNNNKYADCTNVWQNETPLKTLVYNKEFRERNFGNGKLSGVFTLGQATTDEIKVIENKTEELKNLKIEGAKKRETQNVQIQKKEALEKEFTENCWKKLFKKYDKEFKEAFVGSMKSGELFKSRLLQEFSSNTSILETIEVLREKAETIFGDVPQNISQISIIGYDRIIEIESSPIWKKIIIGKADVDIAKLIQKLNINDWINQGRDYIQEDNSTCPFCQQQTITQDFKNQLESFFDETYLSDINSIKDLKQEYNSLTQNLINELNAIEGTEKSFKDTKLDVDKFSAYLKTLISQINTNNEFLNNKIKEPSRIVEMVSSIEQLDLITELISNANFEIKKHNDIVANFTTEKKYLVKSIWKFLIEEFKTEIIQFNSSKNGLESGITALQIQLDKKVAEHKALDTEIKELSKNVTSIQPTINEINRLLLSYGFTNFKIVPAVETGFYQIQRENGEIAEHTLSEGEVTFITFLYYLQLTKGGHDENSINDERILVIDDPISSLDSNILFIVSTLIKEILKDVRSNRGNVKQVILLTHNIYFHKEASFEGLNRGKGEKNNYYILRKINSITHIFPYNDKNPISSSYELLWNEIKDYKNNSGITVQNAMRRIIENYFSILGSKRDDTLLAKFKNPQEKEVFRSLLSWINEGSHTLPDDLYIELPDQSIETYLKVFKDIFIHTNNIGHYEMMMGIEENLTINTIEAELN
ncbi:AAA family ATPase [Flavobacterium sp. CBA20B-1]|uniref:AAA family ATPase n=1 Tax=unclassified Flavobacterium TaxID=196869 RepID=UPI002225176B|nr:MULTISPECIES: AAA family ATPase [unclassified Flavobacterium]WCM41939.1 AAA family ATPase [Flavobacterium sp. CBA20B-1]